MKTKTCVSCRHLRFEPYYGSVRYICSIDADKRVNLVTGVVSYSYLRCDRRREEGSSCGPEGVLWQRHTLLSYVARPFRYMTAVLRHY